MPTTMAAQIIQCHHCGAKNRVTAEQRDRGTPVCGRCKNPLPEVIAETHPILVTDATFAAEVEQSTLPVLVDLWAPWCGPCRALTPILEELAAEYAGRLRVAKVNVDENQATAARFKANSIPLVLIFKNGREVDRIVGLAPKDEFVRRLLEVV